VFSLSFNLKRYTKVRHCGFRVNARSSLRHGIVQAPNLEHGSRVYIFREGSGAG